MDNEAGLELDALVAEKVMGWQMVCDDCGDGVDSTGTPNECPKFSSDIAAAWEVVEKLQDYMVTLHWLPDAKVWEFAFIDRSPILVVDAPTAPLAICKAALKAVSQ